MVFLRSFSQFLARGGCVLHVFHSSLQSEQRCARLGGNPRKRQKTAQSTCFIPVFGARMGKGRDRRIKKPKAGAGDVLCSWNVCDRTLGGRSRPPSVSTCIICEPSGWNVSAGVPAALFRAQSHQSATCGRCFSSGNKRSCSPESQRPTLHL